MDVILIDLSLAYIVGEENQLYILNFQNKTFPGMIQIQFLTAHSTQNKYVISVLIKDCIHRHPSALYYDIPSGVRRHTIA